MAQCLWNDTSKEYMKFNSLVGDIHVDFVIVGGGFSGCSAAIEARAQGASVALVEAQTIGHGGSGRNVGLVNAGLWLPPDAVCHSLGKSQGDRLNLALADAPDVVFDLIAEHDIQCDATRNGTLHCAHSSKGLRDLQMRFAQQQCRQAPVTLLDAAETIKRTGSSAFSGALHDARAGTIQPLSYVQGLARVAAEAGAQIFTMSPAKALSSQDGRWVVKTPQGTVYADKILIATNAYHQDIANHTPHRSTRVSYFQMATQPLPDHILQDILPNSEGCWDTALIMSSFRKDAEGRFVFGAMGQPTRLGDHIHTSWAKRMLSLRFPQLKDQPLAYLWSGDIAMTADHIPKAIAFDANALCLMGYSGRGIGPGTVLGRGAARALLAGDTSAMPLEITPAYDERFTQLKTAYYEFGARMIHAMQFR